MLRYDKGTIYVKGNGKVITSDVTPKFGGWTYDMYLDFNIKFLEPMTCKECTPDMLERIDKNESHISEGRKRKI